MAYKDITPPAGGRISITNGKLNVPLNPILPFIRGDGTGPDIWAASQRVFDAAVQKAYGGKRQISWFEVYAGETAKNKFEIVTIFLALLELIKRKEVVVRQTAVFGEIEIIKNTEAMKPVKNEVSDGMKPSEGKNG